jgi:hypothetical protein
MKRLVTIAAYLMVVVLVGVSSLKSAEPGTTPGQAIVRTVKGHATYTKGTGGGSQILKANQVLDAGDSITTSPDSFVYVSVNGLFSAVRVAAETTMVIKRMNRIGTGREGATETTLDLKIGSIQGQVKKVTGDSQYEISTPHGIAGIRGTDFSVDVVANGNGTYTVTFTSLTGTVVATAVVNGQIQTKTLNGGESWTVGGDVVPVSIQLLNFQLQLINALILAVQQAITITPTPIGPIHIRPQPGGGSASG